MSIRVDIRSDLPSVHGTSRYRRSENGLIYEANATPLAGDDQSLSEKLDQQLGATLPDILVMADTLTLEFSGRDGRFLSLDAYTNDARWQKLSETAHPDGTSGALVLIEPVEDRIALDAVPSYRFREADSTLLISLRDGVSEYFEIGKDLYAGIANGQLAELILKNVLIE